MVDAVASDAPVGSAANKHGNAFYDKRTKFETTGQSVTDYNGATVRTWDLCNTNKLHPYSKKPVSYKLVSREVPALLPKEESLVWKRAGFARHAVHVTRCKCAKLQMRALCSDKSIDRDDQLYPAGRHVPQTSGESDVGLPEWIGDGNEGIDNEDIVLWHTFGLVHFPAPEDFPIMPCEPISVLLRPRNFFSNNPVMDVPPQRCITASQMASKGSAHL